MRSSIRRGEFSGAAARRSLNLSGTLAVANDASFTILNALGGTPGGSILSAASIKLTLRDTNIGHDLNAYIDNIDGKIGPSGDEGTVGVQINGNLAVTNRINIFGSLTVSGTITANQLSATNVLTPSSITVGSGGITRFSYPDEITVNPLHTITANALTSTGGINFNGPDLGTPAGFGPFSGGQLTLNVPSLTFGTSAADNIQGAVTFNGGASNNNAIESGSGGTFTVNATGDITVGSPIEATTGLQNNSSEAGGAGGTVNLNSDNGTIGINSAIKVSSADPNTGAAAPRRHSRTGGNINIQSKIAGRVAINVSNTGQLLSLLEPAAPGPGGKITILATGTNSSINVSGDTSVPPRDTIRADRGTVDIRHTGAGGTVTLSNAQIAADVIKVGALGSNGGLSIGGGRITADTILKLYATGSNGSIVFVSNVLLSAKSMIIIGGNSVTVNNGVFVSMATGSPNAEVYVLDPNKANYSGSGGNGSTSGRFIQQGTELSPVSGANTHLGMAPPQPFDPSPGH